MYFLIFACNVSAKHEVSIVEAKENNEDIKNWHVCNYDWYPLVILI